MAKIRLANEQDAERILELAFQMHAESARYSRYAIHDEQLEHLISVLIEQAQGCLLVAEVDGQIVGMLWGYMDVQFFSQVRIAKDFLLYIEPKRRKGRAAFQLVKRFEAWAFEAGAAEVNMGVSADIDNETAVKFYERLGYTPTGLILTKVNSDV